MSIIITVVISAFVTAAAFLLWRQWEHRDGRGEHSSYAPEKSPTAFARWTQQTATDGGRHRVPEPVAADVGGSAHRRERNIA